VAQIATKHLDEATAYSNCAEHTKSGKCRKKDT